MSELFIGMPSGELMDRTEYSRENKALIENLQIGTHEYIDRLLYIDEGTKDTHLSYSTDGGVARRERSIEYTGREMIDFEDDEMWLHGGNIIARIMYRRKPIVTLTTLSHESYRQGIVAESYSVHIGRYVGSVIESSPFQDTYVFEIFRGGSAKSWVSKLDYEKASGTTGHEMTPYDFAELGKHLIEIDSWQQVASRHIV